MKFKPDTISLASLVIAFASAFLYFLGGLYLVPALIGIVFASFFDAIDGEVARQRNLQSPRGDYVDHVIDRYVDAALIIGIGLSPYGNAVVTIFAVSGIMLTSYLGTQAQAIGLDRDYEGIMGRANRLVLIIVLGALQIILPVSYPMGILTMTPSLVLLIILAIGGHATAVTRVRRAMQKLK
jgi:archaetidylinositol phosphate synthase